MAIKYDERNKSYSRLNEQGKNLGTVFPGDSLGRYGSIASEYKAEQEAFQANRERQSTPSGYDKYKAAAEKYNSALKAARDEQTQAAVQNMTQQIAEAKQQTERANAEAYAAKRIAEKNIGQQLAAAGLNNTGASETARLQNELNWQNTVNSNNQQNINAVQNIQNQIAEYKAKAAAQNAELDASLGEKLNQMYWEQEQNAAASSAAREQAAAELAYQRERDLVADRQAAAKLQAEQMANEQSLALKLLNLGYNSEQIAGALGLTTNQIAARLAAQNAKSTRRSGGSSNSKKTTTDSGTEKLTQSTALKLRDGGNASAGSKSEGVWDNATQKQVDNAYIDLKISEEEWRQIYNDRGWKID